MITDTINKKQHKIISISFISSFSNSNSMINAKLIEKRNSNLFLNSYNKKKTSKQFIFILCLLNELLCQRKYSKCFEYFKYFIQKKSKKMFTLLRAPFRHKLSKKHYIIEYYKLTLIFKSNYFINKIMRTLTDVKSFFKNDAKFFLNNLTNVETNLCSQQQINSLATVSISKRNLNIFYKFN